MARPVVDPRAAGRPGRPRIRGRAVPNPGRPDRGLDGADGLDGANETVRPWPPGHPRQLLMYGTHEAIEVLDHMHQKCSLDRSSQVNLRGAVLWLKYAMSFQDPGQRDEVTPKAHISNSSSHTFSIDMMLIRDELKVWCRQ